MTDVFEIPPDDIPDITQHRAARESAAKTTKVRDQIDAGMEASLAAMSEAATSDKFVAFVQCAEAILPQHTVLKEAWFTTAVTSLMSVYFNYVPPDKLKEFFSVLIDWMYESNCANRGGPPNYPPVVCQDCIDNLSESVAPKHGEPSHASPRVAPGWEPKDPT